MNREFKVSVELVVEFHEKHGELPKLERETMATKLDLEIFFKSQRYLFHSGDLLEDRISILQAISDFDWGQPQGVFEASNA